MSESEEKGYEVKDKRKFKMKEGGEVEETEPTPAEPEAQPEEESPQPEKEEKELSEEEFVLPPIDVYSLLKSFISMLGMHAWQCMGLMMNPSTGKVEKDLVQAKIAINSISALLNQLEGNLSESEQGEIKAMISDLQVNFVRQSQG